jgi:L-rhamnose-H+ transport protein
MQALFGILFHFVGGFASGSFYVPFRKVKGWSWEAYWIVGGLFSWLIVPPIAAALTVPDFFSIISSSENATIWWTYFWGLLWGIGGLTYGLGMRYLGLSLGNSVLLGFTSAFGSLVPAIYYNIVPTDGKTTFSDLLNNTWGKVVLSGIALCLLGIYICGRAGVMKEKELSDSEKKKGVSEFNLAKGLIVCTVSGILSACFNYGIEAGTPMAEAADNIWRKNNPDASTEFLYQNNVIYVVLLLGGLTTNLVWCLILLIKNNTYKNFADGKSPLVNNFFFSALAGTIWFLQFFFYGMGESKLGNGASSWILHMAFIILVSNVWGIALKEWAGVSKKTKTTITIGILAILLSVVLVGYGNTLK